MIEAYISYPIGAGIWHTAITTCNKQTGVVFILTFLPIMITVVFDLMSS